MMHTLIKWADENCLLLNAEKTKSMLVGIRLKLNSISPHFIAGNRQIMFVTQFLYLGITFESIVNLLLNPCIRMPYVYTRISK